VVPFYVPYKTRSWIAVQVRDPRSPQECDPAHRISLQRVGTIIRCGLAVFLLAVPLAGQDGREVLPPESMHQYSGISPLSVLGDKLHTFNGRDPARIVKVSDGSVVCSNAPYPEFHWDSVDNDLGYAIGAHDAWTSPTIQTYQPSTCAYTTYIDYSGRFEGITTGGTTDLTYDNWEAFYAPNENTLCAVDLTAKKTYCVDVTAADPLNHLSDTPNVDYVAVTPRDSKSGLHYVLMMGAPAMAVFSVDETAGVLRWIVRPELVIPWMGNNGSKANNNDGNCDPGEACLVSPHGDVYVAPDGQVYFESMSDMESTFPGGADVCQRGQSFMRLNAGLKMSTPENFANVTGGGMKYIGPDMRCGGVDTWSAGHTGCARWGGYCVISFDTPVIQPEMPPAPKTEELWIIGLDANNAITYNRLGNSHSSMMTGDGAQQANSYWSTARAAMSMDGTQVIYDSDAGSNSAHHAVYQLATGLPAVKLPSAQPPPVRHCNWP
jgi:hypothetical protein